MNLLRTKDVETAMEEGHTILGKGPEGQYEECFRPIGYAYVADGLYCTAGLYYIGPSAWNFHVWFEGSLDGVYEPFTKAIELPWRRTKKIQGAIIVNVEASPNELRASAINEYREDD